MKLAVVDDEKIFIDQFISVLYERYTKLDVEVDTFLNGMTLLDSLNSGISYDALFLDIEMDVIDGMTLAREVRKILPEIPIIFLTSHIEMAIDGYEVSAFRFLRKPIESYKLYQTLEDLCVLESGRKGVIIKENGEEIVVIPSDILFIESENNDVRIVTLNGTYVTRMKLTDAIDLFNEVTDSIRRVHRCSAVNMMHISRLKDKEIYLDNGNIVLISRSYYKEFKNIFYDYVKKSAR